MSSCHAIITLFFKLYSANQFFVTHHHRHHLRIAYFFMFNRSPKMSLLIIITKWFLLADIYSFEVFCCFLDDKIIYYKVAFQQFFSYCWGFPLWLWQIHSFKHLTPDFFLLFLRLPSPFPCIMHTEKHRARQSGEKPWNWLPSWFLIQAECCNVMYHHHPSHCWVEKIPEKCKKNFALKCRRHTNNWARWCIGTRSNSFVGLNISLLRCV